ncbi:MAG TPA: ATP-binding cassette domain-containing protein [Burkholderiales bacterium]|nr:ATP-binding cassette domain-containing protein [Burkholderiales bacterium]
MSLITVSGGCLAFGDVALLDKVDLQLQARERVALIGRNGSGKSSLLAALAGTRQLDDGEIWRAPGVRIGYVAQEPELDHSMTVFQSVVDGMGEISQLVSEYHAVSHQLGDSGADTEPLLVRLHELQTALETLDAWAYVSQAERAIDRFGLDADAVVGTLSGGQKKRLALAQALALTPDVLLLDEPTNHLDIDSIAWLEEFLLASSVTLLFITHDRKLLDRLATRVIELDRGRLGDFPGSYSQYRSRKEQMLADEAVANRKSDKLLREEEVWIRKGIEARRTRSASRIGRLEQLRTARAQRRERMGQVKLQLSSGDSSGQLVAELEGVSKSFGERHVVREFSCRVIRGDKVGIIGPNGAGKTTLLKLILGELEPDSGSVRRGTNVQPAYFDQFREALDPEAALVDVISPGSDYVEIGRERKHVIGYLGEFLFPPQRSRSPVKSLSGGERNRLLLARLFARPANVLVLDEPTNDLDVETLELLEELLQSYTGTLFLVSHDRIFLDNVVTQVIASSGDGHWLENAGGYSDWASYCQRNQGQDETLAAKKLVSGATGGDAVVSIAQKDGSGRRQKLGFREQRELQTLPDRIAELEAEQTGLTRRVEDPALYAEGPAEAQRLASRLTAIDAELTALLERWDSLESRNAGKE